MLFIQPHSNALSNPKFILISRRLLKWDLGDIQSISTNSNLILPLHIPGKDKKKSPCQLVHKLQCTEAYKHPNCQKDTGGILIYTVRMCQKKHLMRSLICSFERVQQERSHGAHLQGGRRFHSKESHLMRINTRVLGLDYKQFITS